MKRSAAFMFSILLFTAAAQATTAQRTFVSTNGDNANTATLCGHAAPCRNFSSAITVTSPGGEVVALDSGGYAPFSIAQSVSIIAAPGAHVAVTASTGIGVWVSAPGATVVLRGLYLNSQGADFGIAADEFTALSIENCVVNGFGIGINIAGASGNRSVFILDSTARNSAGFSNSNGIIIESYTIPSGTTIATIERTRSVNNAVAGILATGIESVIVRDCVASGNGAAGIGASGATKMNIENCASSNNGQGIAAAGGAIVRVSNSIVTDNTNAGFSNASSTFETRSTSTVRGNTPNTSGAMTLIVGQ